MSPFAEILVPLGRSPFDERALPVALDIAHRTGVSLRLSSVAPPGAEADVAAHLAAVADGCGPDVAVATEVAGYGSIGAAIAGAARPGTLVCMASHGESGGARTLLGAATQAVVRAATEPVLLVGPRVPKGTSVGAGPLVACVDGSAFAERTLPPAADWSAALRVPLWLAQVASSPDSASEDAPQAGYLRAIASGLGTPVDETRVLHDRHPLHALAELAEETPVAAFVIATHGRAGWERVLSGSLAAAAVHKLAAPVLVVPPGRSGTGERCDRRRVTWLTRRTGRCAACGQPWRGCDRHAAHVAPSR